MRSDFSLNKPFPILGGCSEGLDALGYYADSTVFEKGKNFLADFNAWAKETSLV